MAYVTIPDSDIDPDSPITTGLMTAYRDNITEVAEGASGARIHPSSALDDTITTVGSQSVGTLATWTPSQGVYNMTNGSSSSITLNLSLFISSAWRQPDQSGIGASIYFDGSNVRIYNANAGSVTAWWQRFDG